MAYLVFLLLDTCDITLFFQAASYSVEGGEVEPPYELVVDAVEVSEELDGLK